MTARSTISAELVDLKEARNVLRVMRESGMANAVVHQGSWTGEIGALIGDAANHMMWADAPPLALQDTITALRYLLRAQRILKAVEGIQPTDRYQ